MKSVQTLVQGGGSEAEHQLTNVLRSSHNLSELLVAADHSGQTKVHDLNVTQRRAAGQQDVLRLSGHHSTHVSVRQEAHICMCLICTVLSSLLHVQYRNVFFASLTSYRIYSFVIPDYRYTVCVHAGFIS